MSHWPRLNLITDSAAATIQAKIEGSNPSYSVKCRISGVGGGAAHRHGGGKSYEILKVAFR